MHLESSNREPVMRHPHANAPAWYRLVCSGFAARALLVLIVLGASPCLAGAQFGMLKKLRRGPDSATMVSDSLAKVQATAKGVIAPVVDTAPPGPSRFQRAKSAAIRASDKFESVTGVSTKDAALAVSGVGVAGIAAKKLGVDPASLANQAMSRAGETSQKRAASKQGGAGSVRGGASTASMQQQMQAMQAVQMMPGKTGKTTAVPNAGNAVYTGAGMDAEVMLAFQQEMMQVAMGATSGDAHSKARLDAWTASTARMEPEMTALSASASTGDMNAMVKLQALQTTAMREWLKGGSAKTPKGRKP